MTPLTDKQFERLQQHIAGLVARVEQDRARRSAYYDTIFQVLHGDVDYTKATTAEKKRAEAAKSGQINAVPDDLMRFGEGALRELTNSVVAIMMPVDTPYAAVGAPDMQDDIDALIAVCRSMSAHHGHRSSLTKLVYHWLATQDTFGHLHYHTKDSREPEAGSVGLEIEVPSLYGAFWDDHIPLAKCANSGEIMGFHEKASLMQIYMEQTRVGPDYVIPDPQAKDRRVQLIPKPENIRPNYRDKNKAAELTAGAVQGELSYEKAKGAFSDLVRLSGRQNGVVRTTMYLRLPPEVLGLGAIKELRIYRLTLINGYLAHIEDFAAGNSTMPVVAANLYGTADCDEYRSYGEHAAALTKMLSAYTNLTKQSMRRESVGPLIIYDKRLFDADFELHTKMNEGVRAIKADIKALGNAEATVANSIRVIDPGSTPARVQEADALAAMFNAYLFPKSSKGDLVNLDRATAFHAALAAGTADISLLSLATLGDDSIMEPLRRMLKHSIMNNVADLTIIDRKKQVIITKSATLLSDLEFEFTPSQPIAGFDRHRSLLTLERAINAAQQMPEAQQTPGFSLALLRSFIELGTAGDMDLDHFFDSAKKLTAEQQQGPDTPSVDPSAVTLAPTTN